MRLYLTFVPGIEDIISELISPLVKTQRMLHGAVICSVNDPHTIISVPCFTNHFQILYFSESDKNIESFTYKLINQNKVFSNVCIPKECSFRVVFVDGSQLVSVRNSVRSSIERTIRRKTKAMLNRQCSDVEFWIVRRTEGVLLFLLRLNSHKRKPYNKTLKPGELHPELTYILNYLSEPEQNDVFIDPFAGSGAIPFSRHSNFCVADKIYAFDISESSIRSIRKKTKQQKIHSIVADVVSIEDLSKHIPLKSITKIVTDPPWGLYSQIDDINAFYDIMIQQFLQVSSSNALWVLLTSRTMNLDSILIKNNLHSWNKYFILVSGKKACIYVVKL